MAITNYGSHDSGLDKIGIMPNSNKFALEGSNPMWKTEPVNVAEDNIRQVFFTFDNNYNFYNKKNELYYFVVEEAEIQT